MLFNNYNIFLLILFFYVDYDDNGEATVAYCICIRLVHTNTHSVPGNTIVDEVFFSLFYNLLRLMFDSHFFGIKFYVIFTEFSRY